MQACPTLLCGVKKTIIFYSRQISCQISRLSGKITKKDETGIRFSLLDVDNPREVEQVAGLCAGQGWIVDENLIREYHRQFPDGSFIARDGRNVIGCVQSVAFNQEHGFLGNLVVKEEHRKIGIGSKLFEKALEALGDRNACLYATPQGSGMYKKKFGFKECDPPHFIYMPRFMPQLKDADPAPEIMISEMTTEDGDLLLEYDTSIHVVEREGLLHHFVQSGHCFLAKDADEKVCGFTIAQENTPNQSVVLAPLFANNQKIAKKLLNCALEKLTRGDKMPKYLEVFVPANHGQAVDLFGELGFVEDNCQKVECLFTKNQVKIPVEKVYSVTNLSIALA